MAAMDPPRRHCTGCGARIWSLTRVRSNTAAHVEHWRDLCNYCDPAHPDRGELFTTGHRWRRSTRRGGR